MLAKRKQEVIQPIQRCKRSLLYQTIAELFEMWREQAFAGQFDGQDGRLTPKGEVAPKPANHQRTLSLGNLDHPEADLN